MEFITDFSTLKLAYKQVIRGEKKYAKQALEFAMYDMYYLEQLQEELKSGIYEPSGYTAFCVYEPKKRLINAPAFRDKIVQYAVHLALQPIYTNVFYRHSYACLTGRGQHRAMKRVQQMMREIKEGWIVKLDITKFFYSVDREILKVLLRKKISEEGFLRLLDSIVNSSPEGEVGIPLGNVTSQTLANIYLNEVDQFLTRFLGVKWYCRFMDDLVWILPTKEIAKSTLDATNTFLRERLRLETNEKTKIFPLKQGVNAYGFQINVNRIKVRDSSKNRMWRRLNKMGKKGVPFGNARQSLVSWLGHAKHGDTHKLRVKFESQFAKLYGEQGG